MKLEIEHAEREDTAGELVMSFLREILCENDRLDD